MRVTQTLCNSSHLYCSNYVPTVHHGIATEASLAQYHFLSVAVIAHEKQEELGKFEVYYVKLFP